MLLHTFLTKLCAKIIEDGISLLNIATTTEYYNDSIVHYTTMHIYIFIGDTLMIVTFMSNVLTSKSYIHWIIYMNIEYSVTTLETSFHYQQLVLPL